MKPPRLADWLLRVLLPRDRGSDIRGDLVEQFRRNPSTARYWTDAISIVVQEQRYRGMRTLDHLRQDLRFAWRAARKAPGFTLLVIVTLGLGIGAATSIFSIVNGVLLRPLPFRDPDRLLWVNEADRHGNPMSVSWMDYLDWRARARSFEALAASRTAHFNLTGLGQAQRLTGRIVTANFFAALGAGPVLGRSFTDADDRAGAPGVAVISHELWQQQLGGDPGVLGRTLMLSAQPFTVVGVLPSGFRYLRPYDVFVAMGPLAGEPWLSERENHQGFIVVGRLRHGVDAAAAARDLERIESDIVRDYFALASGVSVIAEPLAERLVKPIRDTLLVLFGAVSILLVIACMNVASLLIARGAARRHELAVRAALGGGRYRLAMQLLVESSLLSAAGGIAGALMAIGLQRALVAAAPAGTPRLDEVSLDATAFAFAALAATACGILFGSVPALQASAIDGQQLVLRTRAAGASAASHRLRRGVLAVEVALALVLLAGAGLMTRTLGRLTGVELGFEPDHVLSARVEIPQGRPDDARLVATTESIVARVAAIPGVLNAAAGYSIPIDGSNWNGVFWPQDKPVPPGHENVPGAAMIPVTPAFFDALGCRIVKGRAFSAADRAGAAPVAIVNESLAAQMWPNQDPIGKRVKQGWPESRGEWRDVVGVVADIRFEGIAEDVRLQVYMPYAQHPTGDFTLLARTSVDPRSIVVALQGAVAWLSRDVPLAEVRPMSEVVNESIARQRMARLVLGVFAVVAVVLASIGLFGLVAHGVTERRHEIGVRMALGASTGRVVRLLIAGGVAAATAGAVVGLALAMALTKSLSGLLFGVQPFDAATFALALVVLLTVAGMACAIPAWRATRTGITTALRAE